MGFEVFDLITEIYDYQKNKPIRLLDKVSLKANPGEIMAIIGAIGSGKSTFIQHLNGLKKADNGLILIHNESYPNQSREWLKKVGIVQQFSQKQLFLTTVADEIAFAAKNFEITYDLNHLCALVDLDTTLLARHPRTLSGGQMRKVAIASVLAAQPEILILDEPFAGLDWQAQTELTQALNKLAANGMTIALVTHDLNFVYEHCQKVVVFSEGKIIAEKTPKQLFAEDTNWQELGIEATPLLQTNFVTFDEQAVKKWLISGEVDNETY
ncbi:MAG: energy-coupling factor ABC transporter ATP-binding protein [Culicoidibacterales bacterium]